MNNAKPVNHITMALHMMILVFVTLGLVIDFMTSNQLNGALKLFNYYTIQTNFIIFAVIAIRLINIRKHQITSSKVRFITEGATIWSLITMVVFHFMLSKIYHPEGVRILANYLLHYAVPSGMLILFFISDHDIGPDWKYPFYIAGYPLLYGIVSVIRGSIDGFYPYWFLNPQAEYPDGVGNYVNLFLLIIIMCILFVLISYILLSVRYSILKSVLRKERKNAGS
ncbi:MAG: Pr6Pr family membrane protein [Clostridia bacterium]|nr:Pr6Pr family membrane protein [Clostridia bacterium]